jgi:hypothetical protein
MSETGTQDTGQQDTETEDASACVGTDSDENFGFELRKPQMHTGIVCEAYSPGMPEIPIDQLDVDWLCSFSHNGKNGVVYARATPTGCNGLAMSPIPDFDVQCAVMKVDGEMAPLDKANYDFGGGHNNDKLSFSFAGRIYEYFHSSFGWGFRKCQPMDCLIVRDSQGDLIEDGCADRSLPVHCTQVEEDGSYDPLEIDDFAKCPGDSDS